jgi:hypothetical protein
MKKSNENYSGFVSRKEIKIQYSRTNGGSYKEKKPYYKTKKNNHK